MLKLFYKWLFLFFNLPSFRALERLCFLCIFFLVMSLLFLACSFTFFFFLWWFLCMEAHRVFFHQHVGWYGAIAFGQQVAFFGNQ
jgi:hypothetical protein